MLKDIKSSLKHSVIYGIGNIANKIVGFLLIPIYTNPKYLSVADFGVLSILDISSQVLIALFGLSIYQGFIRWYWDIKDIDGRKKLFFNVLTVVSFISILLGIGLSLNTSSISLLLYQTDFYSRAILLITINAVLLSIQVIPNSSMRIQSNSKLYTILNVIKFTINLSFTVYFVVFLKRGIEGIFEAQIIGNLVYFVFSAKHIIKNSIVKLQFWIIKDLFIYSFPLVFASISGIMLTTIDRFSLNYLASLPDVGIYTLGFKIGGSIKVLIIASVQLALTPMLMKRINDPNNKRLYSKVLTYFSFGLMWVILAISIFSREIIVLIARSPEYIEATMIVPIIAMISFIGMAKDSVVMGLHVNKRTKVIGTIIFIGAVVNLALNILLIPLWGIYGAAWASLFAQSVLFTLTYYYAQKSYPIKYELYKVIKIIFVGATLYALSFLSIGYNIIYSVLFKLVLISIYPFLLYPLNFYEKVEIKTLKNGIKAFYQKRKNSFKKY